MNSGSGMAMAVKRLEENFSSATMLSTDLKLLGSVLEVFMSSSSPWALMTALAAVSAFCHSFIYKYVRARRACTEILLKR